MEKLQLRSIFVRLSKLNRYQNGEIWRMLFLLLPAKVVRSPLPPSPLISCLRTARPSALCPIHPFLRNPPPPPLHTKPTRGQTTTTLNPVPHIKIEHRWRENDSSEDPKMGGLFFWGGPFFKKHKKLPKPDRLLLMARFDSIWAMGLHAFQSCSSERSQIRRSFSSFSSSSSSLVASRI